MLCVVVYLYATSLTLWALNVTWWFKSAHALLMDYPDMPLADRVGQANLNTATLGTPMEALFMFNSVANIFTVIDITCLTGAGWSGQTAIAGGGVLIGYKAWIHRKEMSSLNMTGNSRRTSTEKIMSLLVESGFIYCFFWLTQLILFFDVSREKPVVYVYELFSGMGDQISGMYPTLIIVIVNLHQTIWEQSSIDITQGSVQWAGPSKRSEHTASTFTSQRRGIKTLQLGSDVENAGGIDTDVVRSKHIPLTEV
ncbi:hypothetical protein B0H10DRAFT_1938217 [Mycena sp. CBHHK59/15]|nr:hypothetical protein B0H10DRAFT_1938217 [Mycena sp. CBHHK59/15]